MLLLVLLLFLGSLIAPILSRLCGNRMGLILSCLPLVFFLVCLTKLGDLGAGPVSETYRLTTSSEYSLVFLQDGLSLLFALLVTGIGFLILVYSYGYMPKSKNLGRYYLLMMLFMGAMAGMVLSGNLISVYLFWELTSLSSFMLIGFEYQQEKARSAAIQAWLVTAFGGLAMLAGFILMGTLAGGFDLFTLRERSSLITSDSLYLPILFLILLGVWTKSAHFPFHFWLPSAMVAPTPVSAYLHSAAMVNAGIFLLARLNPVLGNTAAWNISVTTAGALTMLIGAYFAMTQHDFKKILAYTTVSALGLLTLLLGLGTKTAVKGALLYLIVHAFYKAALFMIAGTIDKEAGSRDIYLLGNLKSKMPVTTLIALLVLLSMGGLPPMLGYLSKEMIYEIWTGVPKVGSVILLCCILANSIMLFISLIISYNVFLRKDAKHEKKAKETGKAMVFAPAVLAVLSLLLVLFSPPLERLIEQAAEVIKTKNIEVHMELWKGMTSAFWLSLATIALGVLFFVFRKKLLPVLTKINETLFPLAFPDLFIRLLDLFFLFAGRLTPFIQHGYHRLYLLIIFLISSLGLWYSLMLLPDSATFTPSATFSLPIAGVALLSVVASLLAPFTRESPAAIVIMGVVGYGMAIIFLGYGAIDVAITQFLVNTFITVLFVIAVYKLPEFGMFSPKMNRLVDMTVALVVGAAMTGLSYAAARTNAGDTVAEFYLGKSFPDGHGRNVVNVILTDFRALDTLGEITVLAIAALGVSALLKLQKREKPDER